MRVRKVELTMLRFSRSKIIATVAIIVIGLLLAVPSTMNREQRQAYLNAIPSWIPSWLVPSRAIVLGLDLQGGSHVLLEVDQQDLLRGQITLLRDDVRRILRDTRVSSQNGIQTVQRGVQIRVADAADRERLMPRLRELSQPIGNAMLGQSGGNSVQINTTPDGVITLTYTDAGINERVRRAVDQSIEVVRRRIDATGTTEPSIQRQGADRVLVQVGARSRGVLRADDGGARVGGDEFVILLQDVPTTTELQQIAERLRSVVREPLQIVDREVAISMSMGLLSVDRRADEPVDAEQLLRRADRAMYRAKATGRDCWAIYDPRLDDHAQPDQEVRALISRALAEGDVVVHYQPVVDLATGGLVGLEALVRLQHPELGLLDPGRFIEVAERSGQIVAIGDRMIEQAFAEFAEWIRFRPDLRLTVNLSGRELAEAAVCEGVVRLLHEHGFPPGQVVVEVTESTLVTTFDTSLDALARLRRAGLSFAVDDFGTGHSSLSRLTEIAPDIIKLDRTFVASAATDPMHRAVISAVMHLAELTGLKVVAEGVETERHLRTVRELGCHMAQGFLFSQPVPAEEITQWLHADFVTAIGGRADFGA